MVALLGSVLNLGSFGAGWKGLAEDAEELGFGVRTVLAPGLQQTGLPLEAPPRGVLGAGNPVTHPPGELHAYSWGGRKYL